MEKIIVSPETAWAKVLELHKVYTRACEQEMSTKDALKTCPNNSSVNARMRLGQKYQSACSQRKHASQKYHWYLQNLAKKDNAKELYFYLIPRLDGQSMLSIDYIIVQSPYAEEALVLMMENPDFKGFSPKTQMALFNLKEKQSILEECFARGYDLCGEAEEKIFTSENASQIAQMYFSYGFGLCIGAQELMMALLPEEEVVKLLKMFIKGINKKNFWERVLCTKAQFMLLRSHNELLFKLYAAEMRPHYTSEEEFKKTAFIPQVAWVAKNKQWL